MKIYTRDTDAEKNFHVICDFESLEALQLAFCAIRALLGTETAEKLLEPIREGIDPDYVRNLLQSFKDAAPKDTSRNATDAKATLVRCGEIMLAISVALEEREKRTKDSTGPG